MRKTKVKRPEKETATTASDEGHDSSLSGAPSATTEINARVTEGGDGKLLGHREITIKMEMEVICTHTDDLCPSDWLLVDSSMRHAISNPLLSPPHDYRV